MKLKIKHYPNKDIYNLFKEIEVPILDTIVNMELTGVEIDTEYASKMSVIYHGRSDEVQSRIDAELANLEPIIAAWKLSPEANASQKKKDGSMGGKSKVQQLSDPIELSSPTQMAILLYDILKVPVVDKKMPRGTGADILEALAPKYKICSLLLEKREVDILINTFIDKIPEFVQKDGRVHARFNSCGTQTGRFSSTSPNLQQIPSHDKVIRMMFRASCSKQSVELVDDFYKVKNTDEVNVDDNVWVKVKDLVIGDKIINNENSYDVIHDIKCVNDYFYLYV